MAGEHHRGRVVLLDDRVAGDPHPRPQLGALERGHLMLLAPRPHPLGAAASVRWIRGTNVMRRDIWDRHATPGDRAQVDDLSPSLEAEAVQAVMDLVEALDQRLDRQAG